MTASISGLTHARLGLRYRSWFALLLLAAVALPVNGYEATHYTAAAEAGRFKGWPANNGMWIWGDEILINYFDGTFADKGSGQHALDQAAPLLPEQARSTDGGVTWTIEKGKLAAPGGDASKWNFAVRALTPAQYREIWQKTPALPAAVDFTGPGFAALMRYTSTHFGSSYIYYTADKGRTWAGPYRFPDFGFKVVAARPCFMVESASTMSMFITVNTWDRGSPGYDDEKGARTVMVKTADGGLNWRLIGRSGRNPGPDSSPDAGFSIMPAGLRLSPTTYIQATREWGGTKDNRCWVEVWRTDDTGANWRKLSEVGVNGSSTPPSLLRLPNGHIVVTYGYRTAPAGVRARISRDQCATWSNEFVIRKDGGTFDLGYTRDVLRGDGKIVTAYYFNAEQNEPRTIRVSVWDPALAFPR